MISLPGVCWGSDNPKALIVLLHGYGDRGDHFVGLAHAFNLPDVLFWVPNGPEMCQSYPSGFQWFSLEDVDLSGAIPSFLEERMDQASNHLLNILDGINFQGPLLFAGFSQGAAMAMHMGLTKRICHGVLAFSGFYTLKAPPIFKPKVFWVHGDDDGVVPLDLMKAGTSTFGYYGVPYEIFIEEGTPHTISEVGIEKGRAFIQTCLSVT